MIRTDDDAASVETVLLRDEVVPVPAAASVVEGHAHSLLRRERPALVQPAARTRLRRLHADTCGRLSDSRGATVFSQFN